MIFSDRRSKDNKSVIDYKRNELRILSMYAYDLLLSYAFYYSLCIIRVQSSIMLLTASQKEEREGRC